MNLGIKKRAISAICIVGWNVTAAFADNHVAAKLLSDRAAFAPGATFRIGVLFTVPQHAHIYWHNPGDSGLPTSITWTLPEGCESGELQWPMPEAFYDEVLDETSFGYKSEVLLFTTIRAPSTLKAGDTVVLRAKAEWLVCLDSGECVPEDAELELALPVAAEASSSDSMPVFERFAGLVPGTVDRSGLPITLTVADPPDARVTASIAAPWVINLAHPFPRYFPDQGPSWYMTGDNEGFEDAGEIAFVPPNALDSAISGALFLPLLNVDTEEQRNLFLRVESTSRSN